MSDTLSIDFKSRILTIKLNQPERLNALSQQMLIDLRHVFETCTTDYPGLRAIILSAEGRAFSSGADLREGPKGDLGDRLKALYHPALNAMQSVKVPVISAVNGIAAGAGASFALSADFVLCAESASFLMAFAGIGLAPDAGATFILPRLIGEARARAVMMLAEPFSAQTAHGWGMVWRLVPDDALAWESLKLAEKLASGPTKSYMAIRQLLQQSRFNSYPDQLNAEAATQSHLGRTSDFREGVAAFLEKRPAHFTGE